MFLKSLTLKGFKSFADTTTLDLEPGITVIVGPNGSGKSNVVDAVAWVLGAQGPRTVRSTKMEDVIFAGTSKRAALGRAEVSLTIDNTSGMLPIGFTEVTITRTLFRNGDSEYQINGAPVRLLDVQELLSDSGVGRQQHVIVSQGQLDAVLNARPEDRRTIVEEAAGVLKYRRRRERAQRRLEATEANFVRLGDLLREIRRQLRPLERQAEAARQHEKMTVELRALRLHLAGREASTLLLRNRNAAGERAENQAQEAATRTRLAELDTEVLTAEAELSALTGGMGGAGGFGASGGAGAGGDDGFAGLDLGEALARTESAHAKARGLAALLAERRRGIERDRNAFLDEGVVATLEAESARIDGELAQVEADAAALPPQFDNLTRSEAELAGERERFLAEWGAETEPAVAGSDRRTAAAVRTELAAARQAFLLATHDLDRVESRRRSLDERAERRAIERGNADAEVGELEARAVEQEPVDAVTERRLALEAGLTEAEHRSADAESRLRDAQAERAAWQARVDAFAAALDQARARAGAQRLAGLDGIVGTMLDLVDVDPGWEAAFEAAVGEAMGSVIVADVDVAKRALAMLHEGGESGAVLALEALAGLAGSRPLVVEVGEAVRDHVHSRRAEVERALDALLASAVAVQGSWADALDVALQHPALTVVSLAGDRYSFTGWRAGAALSGASGATGEALASAQQHAADARAFEEDAKTAADAARSAMVAAREAVRSARAAEAEAIASRDRAEARRVSLRQTLVRIDAEAIELANEMAALDAQRTEIAQRRSDDEDRLHRLDALLPELVEAEAELAARQARRRDASQRLDVRGQAVATLRRDLEVRAAGIEERQRLLRARRVEIDDRLSRQQAQRVAAEIRRRELDQLAIRTDRLAALTAARLSVLDAGIVELRERRRRQSEAARAASGRLEGLRKERHDAERRLLEIRERIQRSEAEHTELRLRLENLVEQIRREFDCEPEAAMAAPVPNLPDGTSGATRVRELERDLRLLGPVNPLALQEYAEHQERHALIESQLEDVKNSRRDLAKVIKAIDEEIVTIFTAAYADVAENFEKLFALLFPGGHGQLRLTDPDHPLDTGIEVEARPSGKNVKKLSLLSGGERSLTALAYLFAVFRSRPSPFYLMDEVEAALDDVNLHRFLGLLHEFRREAQLLVVSHQKRTMEAADCLYGVTMQPGGSSKVVSERITAAR